MLLAIMPVAAQGRTHYRPRRHLLERGPAFPRAREPIDCMSLNQRDLDDAHGDPVWTPNRDILTRRRCSSKRG